MQPKIQSKNLKIIMSINYNEQNLYRFHVILNFNNLL